MKKLNSIKGGGCGCGNGGNRGINELSTSKTGF